MSSIFAWYFLSLTGRIKRQEFSLGYLGLLAMCGVLSAYPDGHCVLQYGWSNLALR